MLARGGAVASQFAGMGSMSQRPFARSDPRAAIEKASVWFTAYPISSIVERVSRSSACWRRRTCGGRSRLSVDAVTGPVKRAGGISGWDVTPSVDGHFDRISTRIDATFGTSRVPVDASGGRRARGTIIDDIVPGHTGKGADFRLAEMKVGDYPGIYHMAEIPREDWHLLPPAPPGKTRSTSIWRPKTDCRRPATSSARCSGHLPQNPASRTANWSATGIVTGVDGVDRRWVYLHYFKDGQPSINWLDSHQRRHAAGDG